MNAPDIPISDIQLAEMYARFPQLLAEELRFVFLESPNAEGVVIHSFIVKRIRRLCPNLDQLLTNVARAIIETAQKTAVGAPNNGEGRETS